MFSKVAVIERYNGVPTLTFRAANQRHNQIVEAQIQIYLMQDEKTQEGNFLRRFHELKLIRNRTPSFTLSWNIMHSVDEDSPMYGQTLESLKKSRAQIAVTISGTDEMVACGYVLQVSQWRSLPRLCLFPRSCPFRNGTPSLRHSIRETNRLRLLFQPSQHRI